MFETLFRKIILVASENFAQPENDLQLFLLHTKEPAKAVRFIPRQPPEIRIDVRRRGFYGIRELFLCLQIIHDKKISTKAN